MGVVLVSAVVAPSFYFEKRRALANGLATCGSGIGMLAVPLLQQQLIQSVGWRWTLVVDSGCVLLLVPFAFLIRPLDLIEPLPIAPDASVLSLVAVGSHGTAVLRQAASAEEARRGQKTGDDREGFPVVGNRQDNWQQPDSREENAASNSIHRNLPVFFISVPS